MIGKLAFLFVKYNHSNALLILSSGKFLGYKKHNKIKRKGQMGKHRSKTIKKNEH
jgi:hypothetical protein